MGLITLTDAQTEFWDSIADTDSNNRSIDSTIVTRLLNRAYGLFRGFIDDRVYAVAAATSGASFTSSNKSILLTPTNIKMILEVYPVSSTVSVVPSGRALQRWEPWEFQEMIFEDPQTLTTLGLTNSNAYACWRAGTTAAANVGKWNLGVHPLTGTLSQDFMLMVLQEVTALSSGTDKFDTSEAEAHGLIDIAAAIGARLIGRPEEFVKSIEARIPQQMKVIQNNIMNEYGMVNPRKAELPA